MSKFENICEAEIIKRWKILLLKMQIHPFGDNLVIFVVEHVDS